MHDTIFAHQDDLTTESLLRYATALDLNVDQMIEDLKTRSYLPRVKKDFESGIENGVNGTPTFFINGVRHDGDHDAASLIEAVERKMTSMSQERKSGDQNSILKLRRNA
jgi:protein-disulfide isomerase